MKTLEEYLAGGYRSDIQEIASLSRALKQAAATFSTTFKENGWAYRFQVGTAPATPKMSQGTLAMNLCAVGKLLGKCRVDGRSDIIESSELTAKWELALTALIADIEKSESSYPGAPEGHFRSSTFGTDNAMTLSHVAELSAGLIKQRDFEDKVLPKLKKSIKKLSGMLDKRRDEIISPREDIGEYRPGSFVLLRALRACRDIDHEISLLLLRKTFESGLHDQLSFSAIPDSRFDPAELLFCLEGLLLCAPVAVDGPLFQRVLDVLADKQNTSAHWRPNKPFIASDTGNIMLPLSIECANSLMRSVNIMDDHRTYDLFGSISLPLLHRFWNWLEARSVRFGDCVGWHSEHVNEPDIIHIWDTSQVVEFMVAYRALLFKHVARTTLDLSGVKERRPKPLENSLPPVAGGGRKHNWTDVENDREPLKGNPHLQVYADVGRHFVAPHLKEPKGNPSYSMLLYGPPGTGKSTLAELMADTLEWPMLTVTVSDFLGSGGAMVEARAKAIFQMLEAQSKTVILFDEIDSFLLDRDSKFYRDQETLFQFLTPGMLTKINDLRKAKRSIFIIATNYANRIDPAIKRIGRIDHKLLLLPPNLERRRAMIIKAWNQENAVKRKRGEDAIDVPDHAVIEDAAKASYYLGWNDIESAVKTKFANADFDMKKGFERADRSTGPEFYGRRFLKEQPFGGQLLEEARWLYRLANEADFDKFEEKFLVAAGTDPDPEALSGEFEKVMEDIKADEPK